MSKRESVLFVIFLVLSSIAINDTYAVVNAQDFFSNNEIHEEEMLNDKEDIYFAESENTSEEVALENNEENESSEINENQALEDEQADIASEEEENIATEENKLNESSNSEEKEATNNEQASSNSKAKEEKTTEVPVKAPVEESKEQPATKTVEKPVEEPKEEAKEEPVEQPKEQPVEEPKEEPVEEPKEQPVEEPVEEVKEEPVEVEQNTGYFISSMEQEILKYTNEERAKNGLEPLVWESKMNPIARYKAEDMLKNNYFAHPTASLGNINCLQLAQHFGYSTSSYGENLFKINVTGANVLNYTSAKSMVDSWMNSPGHRENILRPEWKKFSAGVICSDDNTVVYSVQHFSVD